MQNDVSKKENRVIKSKEIKKSELSINEDDEIIDPDFKTKFDPGDPSFV